MCERTCPFVGRDILLTLTAQISSIYFTILPFKMGSHHAVQADLKLIV